MGDKGPLAGGRGVRCRQHPLRVLHQSNRSQQGGGEGQECATQFQLQLERRPPRHAIHWLGPVQSHDQSTEHQQGRCGAGLVLIQPNLGDCQLSVATTAAATATDEHLLDQRHSGHQLCIARIIEFARPASPADTAIAATREHGARHEAIHDGHGR